LSQYPIFPWVISDYESTLDKFKENLAKAEAYRDFTLNSGALTQHKRDFLINLFNKEEDLSDAVYGSQRYHLKFGYSNKMVCLAFLNRLEPFTDSFL
jgi:hypothetical protein